MSDSTDARMADDNGEYVRDLRRATLASSVGSALEYFDFALYGLATALIFNKLFFPNLDPAIGTVAAFATFGIGFVARPLGGLFFGTLGDRRGRKWVLVVTILLMGGSTTLVGLLPTYETIGVAAPILLVILRLLQGFGAGAEQAGATVLMSEYAPPRRRGYLAALPMLGIQAGTLLASLVFTVISLLPDQVLLTWAWRVPFVASAALVGLAFFIRVRLRETPTFIELEKRDQVSSRPIREVFSVGRAAVVVGIGLRMAENGGSYIFQSVALAFVTTSSIAVDRSIAAWGVTLGSLIGVFSVPFTGWLSDRVGRVPVYRFGAVFMLLYAFPAWWMLSLGIPWLCVAVVAVGIGVAVNSMLGPQNAMFPELFGNRHRYLGVAMARELSAVLAGGLAGVLGAALLAATGHNWFFMGVYLATLAAITTGATFLVPETRGRDLLRVDDAVRVARDEGSEGVEAELTLTSWVELRHWPTGQSH